MDFGRRFLAEPDAVPPPGLVDQWGPHSLAIELAGGPYSVCGLSTIQLQYLRKRFAPLCTKNAGQPGARIDVLRIGPGAFLPFDFAGGEYTFDLDYGHQTVRLAGLNFTGCIQLGPPMSASLWIPGEKHLERTSIFENFFRTMVAYNLLTLGGVLLHSGAVARNGEAVLFFGRSGAGKSTMSRMCLAAGYEVLSDDMNAVLPSGHGYVVEKLPFAGDLGQTATAKGRYPLKSLYWLQQSGGDRVEDMRPARAAARLVACSAFVNGDPNRVDRLTGNLENIVRGIPCRELHFRKGGSAPALL